MEGMGNLIDYIAWRGDVPRDACPLNEIDWMIFARLCYSPFTYLYLDEREDFMSFRDLMQLVLDRTDVHEYVLRKQDFTLYELLRDAPRYNDIEFGNFLDLFDERRELQFSAYTIHIPNGPYGFLYRGTDETVVGWKENLNMTFQCPVEAQNVAARYFNGFARLHPGKYVLAGHSKGGNLAAYAASFCDYELQDNILDVYNYDGPGFDDMVLVTPQYQNICSRIHTYVPQSSLVGILLGHKEEHMVVHSDAVMLMDQHNMYTWNIKCSHFIYEETVTAKSRYFDQTMRDWLAGMSKEERERFVETVYDMFVRLQIRSLKEARRHWLGTSVAMFNLMKNMDDDTRRILMEGFGILLHCARENLLNGSDDEHEKLEDR